MSSELSQYDREYAPEQSGRRPGPEVLPDGQYDFEILEAALERTTKQQELIFRMEVRVLSGGYAGTVLEKAWFFRDQGGANRLGGDLLTLGLETFGRRGDQGFSFSREVLGAGARLRGVRFRGRKTTSKASEWNGEAKHYLHIDALLAPGRPGPVASAPPAIALPEPARSWQPERAERSEEQIPF